MWLLPDAWGIEALFLSCKTAKISTKKLRWVVLSNTPLVEKMARSYKRWRHSQSVAIQNRQNIIWGYFQIPNLFVMLFLFLSLSTVSNCSGQFGQFSIYTLFSLGQYCIFKKGDCPKGLKKGYVFWDDENGKNINKKGGTLPDGIYDQDTLVYYCCRTDGDKYTPISLPVISPFYLMAFNTPECQRVEGAIATEEFIRFDTENTRNKDRQNGSYPYGAGIANHLLLYCYYESR